MMDIDDFRSLVAQQFHANTAVSRLDIFGAHNEKYLPVSLRNDAEVMCAGYVGKNYQPGGVILIAINPGGGGDLLTDRSGLDRLFYPILEEFKAGEEIAALEKFEKFNAVFPSIEHNWNIWRVMRPTMQAARVDIHQIAFINAVPYRTRENKKPPVSAEREAWRLVTEPSIECLAPGTILTLGKKAGAVIERYYKGGANVYCVPRTNGDTYLSLEACVALGNIRSNIDNPR